MADAEGAPPPPPPPVSDLHGVSMWASAVTGADGYIYALPCNASRILRLGPDGSSELFGPVFDEQTWKWTVGILGPDGCVWGIPGNAQRVLCIYPSGRVEFVGPNFDGTQKWHYAVLAGDGCIYAPPCDAGQVLRIDCARQSITLIGPILGGVGKYCAAAVAADGNVYCPPNHAPHVLRVTTATKQVHHIGPNLSFAGGGGYTAAATGSDGHVYAPPFSANQALRILVGTGEASVEQYGPVFAPQAHKWRVAQAAPDGCIYAPPCNANKVMKFDCQEEGLISLIGPEMPCEPQPEGVEKWRTCVLAGNECIYALPSHAKQVLRIKTGEAARQSPTSAELEAEKMRRYLEEEARLAKEVAAAPQEASDAGSLQDDDDEEENSEAEDVEEWPEEECDGVSLWGPVFQPKWARRSKFRAAVAGPAGVVAPPYHCGQVLVMTFEGSVGHPELCARPCVYFAKNNSCHVESCGFCHMDQHRPCRKLVRSQRHLLPTDMGDRLKLLLEVFEDRAESRRLTGRAAGMLRAIERELMAHPPEKKLSDRNARLLRRSLSRFNLSSIMRHFTSQLPEHLWEVFEAMRPEASFGEATSTDTATSAKSQTLKQALAQFPISETWHL
eukprot:s576_g4.t2